MAKEEDELRQLLKLTERSLAIAERLNMNFLRHLIAMVACETVSEIEQRQKAA